VAEQIKFDGCAQEITAAFGGIIIHAGYDYTDQRNVMRGWLEAWRQLDNALKGINLFLKTVSTDKKKRGRPGGSGGQRVDLFNNDRGCA
jgi:hypothetical protein